LVSSVESRMRSSDRASAPCRGLLYQGGDRGQRLSAYRTKPCTKLQMTLKGVPAGDGSVDGRGRVEVGAGFPGASFTFMEDLLSDVSCTWTSRSLIAYFQ